MNKTHWMFFIFLILSTLVILSCGMLEPAKMAADYEYALRTQAVLDVTKTARTYPQLAGLEIAEEPDQVIVEANGFVDPGWGATMNGLSYQITTNQVTLTFPMEGGPAFGTVNFAFTFQDPNCPSSQMTYVMTMEGLYLPDQGFTGTTKSTWTGHFYTFYETCKKYTDADYDATQEGQWQGALVEDGDELVIELTLNDLTDPENTWAIYLSAPAPE